MRLTVLLASFNGELYIEKQIQSILEQLSPEEELIVSDDGSSDKTREIVAAFNDPRVTLILGPGNGINANFKNAYKHASGDGVLFSDQDDLWLPGRAQFYRDKLELNDFVICDAEVIDENGNILLTSYFKKNRTSKTFYGNLVRCRTLGCCIGFRRDVFGSSLPIHNSYEVLPFDYSLTLLSLWGCKVHFSDNPYHQYRRHSKNFSSGGEGKSGNSFWRMVQFRLRVIMFVFVTEYRSIQQDKNWILK
jgi:glycosyltransferase involved in cell wall biosynthesis